MLTSHGKPFAVIFPLPEDNFEEMLKSIRFAMAKVSVSQMRKVSKERGTNNLSMKEIKEEIRSVRKKNSSGH